MKFCSNCGQKLADNANFCSNCGTPIKKDNEKPSQRKIVYDGEIHKCPNCGEPLKSFTTNCPSCNYELRGTTVTNLTKELSKKLEQIENNRTAEKPHSILGKFYGSDGYLSKTDEAKINLIRSFAIPNTREDILEFIILASSNIDLKLYGLGNQGLLTASQRALSDAWLAKFEQAYEKATLCFEKSSDFSIIQNLYDKKQKQIKSKKLEVILLIIAIIGSPLVLYFLVDLIFSLSL